MKTKPKQRRDSARLAIAMNAAMKARIEQLAREDRRSIASMLRILVERGVEATLAK